MILASREPGVYRAIIYTGVTNHVFHVTGYVDSHLPVHRRPSMNARRRPSPGPATSTSRKRGWESAFVEHSLSSNLDTPGKNRDMGPAHIDDLHEAELMASDIGVYVSQLVQGLNVSHSHLYLSSTTTNTTTTHSFITYHVLYSSSSPSFLLLIHV